MVPLQQQQQYGFTESAAHRMETFLTSRDQPMAFKLNAATTFFDLPQFVNNVIKALKNGQLVDLIAGVRWDDCVRSGDHWKVNNGPGGD